MRVLHVIGKMDKGGAETFIMNLYRSINRAEIQFDFLVQSTDNADYDDEILELGGKIFRIPQFNILNFRAYRTACSEFFDSHPEHAVVHGHIGSSAPLYLSAAKQRGRFTIAHSHSVTPNDSVGNMLFNALAYPTRNIAHHFMACSQEAAISRFGRSNTVMSRLSVVKNGIITREYRRNTESIQRAKKTLGLGDEPIFTHIGRFTHLKNHSFLIKAFREINTKLPNSMLLLAGRGEMESDVRRLVSEFNLERNVLFLGVRDDIPLVLNASDVFLFPSINEGLGIALIEAQAAGVQSIASANIPHEAFLTDRVKRLPIDDSKTWATEALGAYAKAPASRDDKIDEVKAAGYDIESSATELQNFYLAHAQSIY